MSTLRPPTQTAALTILFTLLIIPITTEIVSANLAALSTSNSTLSAERNTALCSPSNETITLLRAIRTRMKELDERELALQTREQDLETAGQQIRVALEIMEEAERQLVARMHQSNIAAEEDIIHLVSVYEGMKPSDAAALFEEMSVEFAAGFLAHISPDVVSNIFSNLSPDTAYAISTILAGRNINALTEDSR